MPEPIPQEEYCKLSQHVSKPGRAELTSGRRSGYCTNQDLETTKQSRREEGVSGILKRGRQGHATLCLSLDTSGTGCRDYKSELSDRVLESARMNSGGIQGTHHFMCPYSTTQRGILGWDTHKTNNQKKHKERAQYHRVGGRSLRHEGPKRGCRGNGATVTAQHPPTLGTTADKGDERRSMESRNPNIHLGVDRRKPGGNTIRNVGKRTAEHSRPKDDEKPPTEAHAETYTGRGTGSAKVEWAEASGAPPEAAENCGAAREADKANGAILGATEDRGGMNKPD